MRYVFALLTVLLLAGCRREVVVIVVTPTPEATIEPTLTPAPTVGPLPTVAPTLDLFSAMGDRLGFLLAAKVATVLQQPTYSAHKWCTFEDEARDAPDYGFVEVALLERYWDGEDWWVRLFGLTCQGWMLEEFTRPMR